MARLLQLFVAEVVHGRDRTPTLASTYSVEVSGWDHSHTFFVERSELTWSEETGKLLTLSRRLPPAAMIFVRLLQPADGDRTFPVPYETKPCLTLLKECNDSASPGSFLAPWRNNASPNGLARFSNTGVVKVSCVGRFAPFC